MFAPGAVQKKAISPATPTTPPPSLLTPPPPTASSTPRCLLLNAYFVLAWHPHFPPPFAEGQGGTQGEKVVAVVRGGRGLLWKTAETRSAGGANVRCIHHRHDERRRIIHLKQHSGGGGVWAG